MASIFDNPDLVKFLMAMRDNPQFASAIQGAKATQDTGMMAVAPDPAEPPPVAASGMMTPQQQAASANSPSTPNDTRLVTNLQSADFYTEGPYAGMTLREQADAQGVTLSAARRERRLNRDEMDVQATVANLGPEATPQEIIDATLLQQGGGVNASGASGATGKKTKGSQSVRQSNQNAAVVASLDEQGVPLVQDLGNGRYGILNTGYGIHQNRGAIESAVGGPYETHGPDAAPGEYQTVSYKEPDGFGVGDFIKLAATTAIGSGFGSAASGALGLSGALGGAVSGGVNAGVQGAVTGDFNLKDVGQGALTGGIIGAGGDYIKDAVSGAIDPATGVRATTSDFGGLFGQKGIFPSIPEVDVTGVRGLSSDIGDFFFGPTTNQEWVQMVDGTRLVPDASGNVQLPSGDVVPIRAIQQSPGAFAGVADTLLQPAGSGGLLSPLNPAISTFNTAFTPIADDLAGLIVGDNPWHDERLTVGEQFEAPRNPDVLSDQIYRELPGSSTPPQSEEEKAATQPIIVGGGERVTDGGTQETVVEEEMPSGGEENIIIVDPNDDTDIPGAGEDDLAGEGVLPSGSTESDELPTLNDDELPVVPNDTTYYPQKDEVSRTEELPPPSTTAPAGPPPSPEAKKIARKVPDADVDSTLFRLARIMKVKDLSEQEQMSIKGIMRELMLRRGDQAVAGDVTAAIDERSTRYIEQVETDPRTGEPLAEDPIEVAIAEVLKE